MKLQLIILLFFFTEITYAQTPQLTYAHEVIDTICSPFYEGRGYSNNSDSAVAEYLTSEFSKNNLLKFNENYIQKFYLSTNTFSSKNEIFINNKKLIPDVDFVINTYSQGIKGEFKVFRITPKLVKNKKKFLKRLKSDFSNKIIIFDTLKLDFDYFAKNYPEYVIKNLAKAKAFFDVSDKNLIYVPSQQNFAVTHFTVKKNCLPSKIKTIKINFENTFLEHEETQNLIGYIKGQIDTFVVFSAHYDHIGLMGKGTYFPGANDNASGVAMVLNLAKHYSSLKEKPKYSIAFMLFSGEELGLLGSEYYSENPLFSLEKIRFLVNLDMVGSGDKGIQIVNGKVHRKEFDKIVEINEQKNYLPKVKIRGAAANSDHYFFHEKGVKTFFIYTLGEYQEYHNIFDSADAVPLSKFTELYNLMIDFVKFL